VATPLGEAGAGAEDGRGPEGGGCARAGEAAQLTIVANAAATIVHLLGLIAFFAE
jgi:hypothetical protein